METTLNSDPVQVWGKIKSTAGSQNFFVSLITLVLFAFDINNLGINVTAEEILSAIQSGESNTIILILINFVNPILKLIQKTATWSWDFVKSKNFITQVGTVILMGVTYFIGVSFPEGAAGEVVDSVGSGMITAIVLALIINIINPLIHFFTKDKPKEDVSRRPMKPRLSKA